MKSHLWWLTLASLLFDSSYAGYKTEDNLSNLFAYSDDRQQEPTPSTADESKEEDEEEQGDVYKFLYKRMQEDAKAKKKEPPKPYMIPGPQEPLPGRTHQGDYWPVFPFHNQYSGGVDLDPSTARHIGGDFNLAVPSWGMLDIYGRFWNRIPDTTTKFGYINHPVNMLDLEKEDLVQLMSNPSNHWNRAAQPTLPLGKLAKQYVPLSCKPPLCNPYHHNFGLGIEHDWGGSDGVEGDIDVPIPLSKGVAYRFPLSGKVYYDYENMTITYGQNLSPVDPFSSLFDYQKTRAPEIAMVRSIDYHNKIPFTRTRRSVEVINNKSNSKPVHSDTNYDPNENIDVIVKPIDNVPHSLRKEPAILYSNLDFISRVQRNRLIRRKPQMRVLDYGNTVPVNVLAAPGEGNYFTNYNPIAPNIHFPRPLYESQQLPYAPPSQYAADDSFISQQMQKQYYQRMYAEQIMYRSNMLHRRNELIRLQKINDAIQRQKMISYYDNVLRNQYARNMYAPMFGQ